MTTSGLWLPESIEMSERGDSKALDPRIGLLAMSSSLLMPKKQTTQ